MENSSFKKRANVSYSEYFQSKVMKIQRLYCKRLTIDKTIAMNEALRENLFVTIICILTKVRVYLERKYSAEFYQQIPVFIVGKPGTSKVQ
jgi:hypothetical protein